MSRKPQRRPEAEKSAAYRAGERMGAWSTKFIMVYLVAAGALVLGVTRIDGPLRVVLIVIFVFLTAFVLLTAIATRDAFWMSLVAYILIVIGGSRVQAMEPKLSMWLVWTIGMVAWAVMSIVIGRRYQ